MTDRSYHVRSGWIECNNYKAEKERLDMSNERQILVDQFVKKCEMFHVKLSDTQVNQLLSYYDLLIETNKVMNLTAITEFSEVLTKHFLDSLSIARYIDFEQVVRVLDLGTGAGFPGIPLKIVYPEVSFVLADSLNKRIQFLNAVVDQLHFKNITCVHGRAEDLARQEIYREQFDLVTSRAVANLSSLSEYCVPFVREGGMFVAYKSGEVREELDQAKEAIRVLGGTVKQVNTFELPGTEIARTLLCIQKIKKTPRKFPRKAGVPTKEPIRKRDEKGTRQ